MSEISPLQERNLEVMHSRMTYDDRHLPAYVIEMALRTPVQGALQYMGVEHIDDGVEKAQEWKDIPRVLNRVHVPYEYPLSIDPFTMNPFYHTKRGRRASIEAEMYENIPMALALHDAMRAWGFIPGPRFISDEAVSNDSIQLINNIPTRVLLNHALAINDRFNYPFVEAGVPFRIYSTKAWLADTSVCPEVVITIPIAQGEERQTLPKTLDALAKQSLDPRRFVIQLLHNRRFEDFPIGADGQEGTKLEPDDEDKKELRWLHSLLRSIESKYPDLQISSYHQYLMPHEKIGTLRHNGTLLALLEMADSGYLENPSHNPLLLNLDADISRLNVGYLENMVTTSELHNVPVVSSNLQWDLGPLRRQAPTAMKILKLSKAFNSISHEIVKGFDGFYDCGTAIRAKEYLLAGGHNPFDAFYENGNIVMAVKDFAHLGSLDKTVRQSRYSYFSTNIRRQVYTMLLGHNPYAAWDPGITTFDKYDDPVRVNDLFSDETLRQLETTAQTHAEEWIIGMSRGITEDVALPRTKHIDESLKIKRRRALDAIDIALASQGYSDLETIKQRYYEKIARQRYESDDVV